MRFLKRLPIYASGAGLTGAVVAVSDAQDWSGWRTLAVALLVVAFYVIFILVPWVLMREQAMTPARPPASELAPLNGNGSGMHARLAVALEVEANDAEAAFVVFSRDDLALLHTAATSGPVALTHSEPQFTTG